jgi:hypothetical protein
VSRVSYQAMLGGAATLRFEPLPDQAIATRRRDARAKSSLALSKAQAAWLDETGERAGLDAAAIARALIDLGRALDIDWDAVDGGASLREAVRRSVLVHRRGPGAG